MTSQPQLLIDSVPISLQVVESGENGKMVVRGEYAYLNRATANKRLYTEALMRRELGRMGPNLSEKKVFGELDHPADGRTQLQRTSHIITNLRIEDGRIVGESEILDTTRGRDLQALLKSGAKVGVSSRGFGSTMTNEAGEEVVQDDFRLVTFDFVADPANHTSYPEVFYEEKKPEMTTKGNDQSDPAKLKEEFAATARAIFAEGREAIREEERAKLLSDPTVGADKKVVEEIAGLLKSRVLPEDAKTILSSKEDEIKNLKAQIAEQSLKIKSLEDESSQLSNVAREVGYKYFLEQTLAGDPNASSIKKLVGDVTLYESHEQLTKVIDEAKQEFQRQIELVEQSERKRQRELQIVEEDKKQVQSRLTKMEEALDKSSRLNNLLALELYAERRLANHPKAEEIRKVIESSEPETQAAVDQIIEGFRETTRDPEDNQHVRARIRAITKGGTAPTAIDEEKGSSDGDGNGTAMPNYNNLGVPIGELKKLAGIQ